MNVFYNPITIKISNDDIPDTFKEFIATTLPENFEPKRLPKKYALSYLDKAHCPITVMNQKNYQTMCKVMQGMESDLALCITPEQILKVEEGTDEHPFRNRNLARQNTDETTSINANANANIEINREHPQEKVEIATYDQEADRSFIAKEEVPAEINENHQSNAYSVQNHLKDHPIFTHENIEWIVKESDVWSKGLSERGKGMKTKTTTTTATTKKSLKKRSKKSQLSRSKRKVNTPEKIKTLEDISQESNERVEKKIKTSPAIDQSEDVQTKFSKFRNNYDDDFRFETDFEAGSLKVMAFQKQISTYRSKPNTAITDARMKLMMEELLEALNAKEFNSRKIKDLVLNFKNCPGLSKNGLSDLLQIINSQFENIGALKLDFSSSSSSLNQDPKKYEMALDRLQSLETLEINLSNCLDLTQEETNTLIEGIRRDLRKSLQSFNFSFPTSISKDSKTIKDFESKFSSLKTLPYLKQ